MRKVLHVDLDAFYAMVELRDDPRLRGRPVAVAWRGPRSVVTTATYEARAYGVRSALPLRTALARCPELVVVEPRMDAYREASRIVQGVFREYTDLVEPLSLDEAYLDVSTPKRGPPSGTLIAREIKREIFSRTGGLTASAGVASTKFVAKLASGMNKPDGLTVVRPHEVDALITALPVDAFHGVGPKTAQRLRALGVTTGAELRGLPLSVLMEQFGEKGGTQFWRIARGIDERPVDPSDDRRSVGAEETFDTDVSDLTALRQTLEVMATRTSVRLAGQKLAGRTVTLKVKFANFQTVTRRVSLPVPVRAAADVTRVAATLLTPELLAGRAVRLLGVTVSSLERVENASGQGFLFPPW